MARALVPLNVIASNICNGLGDPTGTYKFTILRHLADVYREMHLFVDHDFQIKTEILDCDNVIEMPKDFVYETKVGLMRNGKIAILTLDKNMPTACFNQTETTNHLEDLLCNDQSGFRYPFYNGPIDGLYGYGCHLNRSGIYNINKRNGTIEIGSLVPAGCKLIIEYKSDGISAGLELIPAEMVDAISYGAKERWFEEKQNLSMAAWNGAKHKEKYYMVKNLLNFTSALYICEVAYNSTSEI